MPVAETVMEYLKKNDVEYDVLQHTYTNSSAEIARALHIDEDHIAKAVVVKDQAGYAVVVVPASEWLKVHALADELGRDFSLASETEISRLFSDCDNGAIPPLGHAYGLDTYLDEALTSLANVYFEAGDHRSLIHVHGNEFKKLFKGLRHGHFAH